MQSLFSPLFLSPFQFVVGKMGDVILPPISSLIFWVLASGFWDDEGVWEDEHEW